MTEKEAAQLLTAITTHYPRSGIQADKLTLAAWLDILSDRTIEEARAALRIYVRGGHEFAPNAGQLYRIIYDHTTPPIDEAAVWEKIRRAVSYASHYDESRMIGGERVKKSQAEWAFAALPADIQDIVGSPAQLIAWQRMPDRQFEDYEKGRFFAAYKEKRRRGMELSFAGKNAALALKNGDVWRTDMFLEG